MLVRALCTYARSNILVAVQSIDGTVNFAVRDIILMLRHRLHRHLEHHLNASAPSASPLGAASSSPFSALCKCINGTWTYARTCVLYINITSTGYVYNICSYVCCYSFTFNTFVRCFMHWRVIATMHDLCLQQNHRMHSIVVHMLVRACIINNNNKIYFFGMLISTTSLNNVYSSSSPSLWYMS